MAGSRPGRAPLPSNVRRLRGETRPSRLNDKEPVPQAAEVKCPSWLSAKAKAVWRRLAPPLIERKVLTAWDVDAFAILCDAIVQYREASEFVAKSNVLIRGRKDALVKNPAMQVCRDTAQTVRAYAQEFGLTPSARTGIQVEQELASARGVERLLS